MSTSGSTSNGIKGEKMLEMGVGELWRKKEEGGEEGEGDSSIVQSEGN